MTAHSKIKIKTMAGISDFVARMKAYLDSMSEEEKAERNRLCDEWERTRKEESLVRRFEATVPDDCLGARKTHVPSGELGSIYDATASRLRIMRESGSGVIILSGASGVGKTWLASWLIWQTMKEASESSKGSDCMYVFSDDLARRYKKIDSFSSTETRQSILRDIKSRDLIVLDEVGFRESEYEKMALYDTADSARCPIVMATNLTGVELRDYIGAGTYDRLVGRGVYAPPMAGLKSLRAANAKK